MKRRAVANYLKRARVAAGFATQAEFAKAAGVTQQQISNYEKNGRVPQENIGRIARALNVPVDELAMMLVEAAEEDERSIRRERDVAVERHNTLMDRFQVFADRYEELGHTYAANHAQLAQLIAQGDAILKRLETLEQRLLLPEAEDPRSGRMPRSGS